MTNWVATGAAGLNRLEAFLPNAGRAYARDRNHDFGAGRRDNVSALSPWIRHRLILEGEVLRRVQGAHGFSSAEKFIQEVYWRAYFKGWLEHRPSVWHAYQRDIARLADNLPADYAAAVAGETGIECFDHWARELVETGWLHNHARMWFASIWIFTFRLPWQLGADFFLRHLLDGDPASNTLSWRWVGGLHTKGKTYLARADNIARYTEGRFNPSGQLATSAPPLEETDEHPGLPLDLPAPPNTNGRWGLLLTEEDLNPETLRVPVEPHAIATVSAAMGRSDLPVADSVTAFTQAALDDADVRTAAHFSRPVDRLSAFEGETIRHWMAKHDLIHIVMPYQPVGPARDGLTSMDLPISMVVRDYDASAWPHATAGFFKLKKVIPQLLGQLG